MCGRYALIDGKKVFMTFAMLRQAEVQGQPMELLPRYNASPQQTMPVAAVRGGTLTLQPMKWWLIPHWSKDGKTPLTTFNAKAETLASSKLFAPYFKSSRCLVPAEAFFEWQRYTVAAVQRDGTTKEVEEKRPQCILLRARAPFMFAGLFSVWKDAEGNEHPTYTIITTSPNELMANIHTRMPVILPERHFEPWLDRENKDTASLQKLLLPYPAGEMEAYPVSPIVNSPRNNVPECLEPVAQG